MLPLPVPSSSDVCPAGEPKGTGVLHWLSLSASVSSGKFLAEEFSSSRVARSLKSQSVRGNEVTDIRGIGIGVIFVFLDLISLTK